MSSSPIIREASLSSEGNEHKRIKSLSHRLSTKVVPLSPIDRLSRNSTRRAWKPKPSVQRKGQSLVPRNDTNLMTFHDVDSKTSRTLSVKINPPGSVQERDEQYVDCFLPKRKIHHIKKEYRVFIHSFQHSSAEVQSLKRPNSERRRNKSPRDQDLYAKSSFFDHWRTRRHSLEGLPCKQILDPTALLIFSGNFTFKQIPRNSSNMDPSEHFFTKSKQVFDTCLKSDKRHDAAGKTYNHGG